MLPKLRGPVSPLQLPGRGTAAPAMVLSGATDAGSAIGKPEGGASPAAAAAASLGPGREAMGVDCCSLLPSLLLSRLSSASFCWSASYSLWSLSIPRSRLWAPDTRRDSRLVPCLLSVAVSAGALAVAAGTASSSSLVAAAAAAAAACGTGGAGCGAAARMLLAQRADLPAAAVVLGPPLGVLPLLVVGTLGCVAVRARPNARATGAFWMLLLLSADPGCLPAAGCLAADLVSTPVCCDCAAPAAAGVALPALPLDRRVVYLGVVVLFSLSVAALVGVDLGRGFALAGCCAAQLLLCAELGRKAGRCCHDAVRGVSFESINASSTASRVLRCHRPANSLCCHALPSCCPH